MKKKTIKINMPTLQSAADWNKISAHICIDGIDKEIWAKVPKTFSSWISEDRLDGFVVASLLPAMKSGLDIIANGPVSSKLIFQLNHITIPLLASSFPEYRVISIFCDSQHQTPSFTNAVVTGFSGGIDSLTTLIDHWKNETIKEYRITHLIFNNVGSHGENYNETTQTLFLERYNKLKNFTTEIGLDLIKVDTNFHDVFKIDFVKMHSALNAAVSLILSRGISVFFYSSAYDYLKIRTKHPSSLDMIDPILLPNLSTEAVEMYSVGSKYTRVVKTSMIANQVDMNFPLDVCVNETLGDKNCGKCFKCIRTIMALYYLGKLNDFEGFFDLAKWLKYKNWFFIKMLFAKSSSYEAEIRDLIMNTGSKHARILMRLIKKWHSLKFRLLNPY